MAKREESEERAAPLLKRRGKCWKLPTSQRPLVNTYMATPPMGKLEDVEGNGDFGLVLLKGRKGEWKLENK